MQIAILNGIYTDQNADFRTSYPKNLIPVPKDQGISKGYLRPADGLVELSEGPGTDRGGINWNGVCYRVMGTSLVSVDSTGTIATLGDVGPGGTVSMDYSFDRLAISSGGRLYFWDGALTQNTDPDLGYVVDFMWIDGFFMTTDGENLVVTELNDPLSVVATKYGSSEVDPDPVKGVLKLRSEACALNRYTIETFNNIGGENFPYQRIEGAQIQKGVIGTYCADVMLDRIAFLGSGRNEAPAVWLGQNSTVEKISTREIDQILSGYTESELSLATVETKAEKGHQHLYVHLVDQTLVYDAAASAALGEPAWFILASSLVGASQYRAKNFVWCYDKWICGDPTTSKLGYTVSNISSHYGDVVGWEFGTSIIYNESRGAIFHDVELVCLPGRSVFGTDPSIWTSYSVDGETWGQEMVCKAGKTGQRDNRIAWFQQGCMEQWRIQKFRGTSDAHISMARLEANLEALYV